MRMAFGKFKGQRIEDLPNDYLEWLASIELRGALKGEVPAGAGQAHPSQWHAGKANPKMVDEIITAGLHTLSLRYHPDIKGGSQMIEVNSAADWLRMQVRALP